MLRRLSSHVSRRRGTRAFASQAFTDWSGRLSALQSKYPGLYSASFESEQDSLLSGYKSQRDSLISEYEAGRTRISSDTGYDVFKSAEAMEVEAFPFRPLRSSVLGESDAQAKFDEGSRLVSELFTHQARGESATTIEEKNLAMIAVGDLAQDIDEWRASFDAPPATQESFGMPMSDEEMDAWVLFQFNHYSPEEGVEDWLPTLDGKLADFLAQRDPSFDRSKWDDFCAVTNELFHPSRIDHYAFHNLSKGLFRGALWDSKSRPDEVEKSILVVERLMRNKTEDYGMQMRRLYELYPDAPLKQVAAMQLKLTDPLFAARLADDMRVQLEKIARERAVRDVIAPLEVPDVESRMAEARTYVENPSSIDENNCVRHLRDIEAERRSYEVEVPELDAIADEVLERRLWGGDTSRVRSALLDFAKGSGSLSALQSAIDDSISALADSTNLDDDSVLQLMIRFHNAKFVDVVSWDLQSILSSANKKNPPSIDAAKSAIRTRLAAYDIDPLVVSLLCRLAETCDGDRLESVIESYKTIMKTYRGEVDALLMSAEELDSATFEAIKNALETANPDKTITLATQIEPGLGAGFVIKAGVQRFDFSLAAHIDDSRKTLSL